MKVSAQTYTAGLHAAATHSQAPLGINLSHEQKVWDFTNLAADFLAGEVLVLEVALLNVLLGCQHHSRHPHPELF